MTLATASGIAGAAHGDDPTIRFPDGTALVLEKTQGPLQAAVRTTGVYMPAGGWVVISTDVPPTATEPGSGNVVGRSTQRLPAGHFRSLLVAVAALDPGTHHLYATLFKGDRGDQFPGEGAAPYGPTYDQAEITFE